MRLDFLNYKYGNYANKTYRFSQTREDWINYITEFANENLVHSADKYNFNRRNGVYAQLEAVLIPDNLVESINYCLIKENDGNYNSVWFVTGYTYIRKNLYRLDLKRDLLSENFDKLLNTSGRVVRGFVDTTKRDSRLLVPETMNGTFVKTNEYNIFDDFGATKWLTLFVSGDWLTGDPDGKTDFEFDITNPVVTDYDIDYDSNFALKQYIRLPNQPNSPSAWIQYYKLLANATMETTQAREGEVFQPIMITNVKLDLDINRGLSFDKGLLPTTSSGSFLAHTSRVSLFNTTEVITTRNIVTHVLENILGFNNVTFFNNNINSLNGKILKYNDGYYRMSAIQSGRQVYVPSNVLDKNSTVTNIELFYDSIAGLLGVSNFRGTTNSLDITSRVDETGANFFVTTVHIELTLIEPVVPLASRMNRANLAINEPYKILTIPLNNNLRIRHNGLVRTLNEELSRNIINNLLTKYSDVIVDAQILPYCPSDEVKRYYNNDDLLIDMDAFTDAGHYGHVVYAGEHVVPIFNIMDNNVIFQYNHNVSIDDYKRDNIFTKFRIVSGSYKSSHDFNYVANDGINGFRVAMTTRPFNTFIMINQNYNWLYGSDFKDLRGLVISEDFSITRATDAWEQYQMNNLNYQNSFNLTQETDRNMLNVKQSYMDKELNLKQWETSINGIANATKAGFIGSMAGGVGAVIGAGGSIASSITSLATNEARNENAKAEQREMLGIQQDTAKRQFTMFLENIQHMPQNITKVTGFHTLSKYFPILEMWRVSDQEQKIINDYLKYNGFKLDVMGQFNDYVRTNDQYDYLQFIPYIVKVYANTELNTALTEMLANGVYIMYNDSVIDF